MNRQKIRIRFRKEGDLRLISHRDLARAWERLFRRAGLPLAMSEGFHPHPRMTFPSALALGMQGNREVVDVLLQENPGDAAAVHQQLATVAPPGLVITEVTILPPDHPKPRIEFVTYEIPIPVKRRDRLQSAIAQLWQRETLTVQRNGKTVSFNVRTSLEEIALRSDRLIIRIPQQAGANLNPRDLLRALELDDLESQGDWLTRTDVHLANASRAAEELSR